MGFAPKIKEKLAYKAAYICSNSKCNSLTVGPTASEEHLKLKIGEAAHIIGEGDKAARHIKNHKEINDISNGIWLCASCHTMVDANGGGEFSIEDLRKWKADHEQLIQNLLHTHKTPFPIIKKNTINGEIAQNVINEIDNHGALSVHKNMENADYVVRSIERLRKFLTEEIKKVSHDKKLLSSLKDMRTACIELMNHSSDDINIVWPFLEVLRIKIKKESIFLINEYMCDIPKNGNFDFN